MTNQQNRDRRRPKTIHVVRFNDITTGESREWIFTSQKTAQLAIIRLSDNPDAANITATEKEIRATAPVARTVAARINLDGAVLETTGPFADTAGNDTVRLANNQLVDKPDMTYTGPGHSKKQAKENAQQLRADLIKANLWPQSPTELMQITHQYQGLPWWLRQPPTTPAPGRGNALHGLLICPDCSQFLDERWEHEEAIYDCPGSNPECRCKNIPSNDARHRIITSLLNTVEKQENYLATARQIQGDSTDAEYLRSLATHTLETEEEIHHHLIKISQRDNINVEFDDDARATLRAAIKECIESGYDPLAQLQAMAGTCGTQWQHMLARYVMMLLTRPDSNGAAEWMRHHIRCAEIVPGAERIHYRRPYGPNGILQQNADTKSFMKRIQEAE